jgi:DNA-binding protein YbaB
MSLPLDAAEALIADLTRRMQALRSATYEGHDRDKLAVVTITGDGEVTAVRLAQTVARHSPDEVSDAIRAAVDAAQQQLAQAYSRLAVQAEEWGQQHDDRS